MGPRGPPKRMSHGERINASKTVGHLARPWPIVVHAKNAGRDCVNATDDTVAPCVFSKPLLTGSKLTLQRMQGMLL